MADTVWETGVIKTVLHPVGKSEAGRMRYRLGNYEVLNWASQLNGTVEQYVVPVGIVTAVAGELAILRQDIEFGREFGYYDGSSMVVEFHQGDGSDTLPGLHSFGIY